MNTNDNIITLQLFSNPVEANAAKNKLGEIGIESFLADENVAGLNPSGEIELKIFKNDFHIAKDILSRS
jgi:hypothetical protein